MPSGGYAILEAFLFIGGLVWCIYFARRLPADLAELVRTFKRYRESTSLHSVSALREKSRSREQHRREYARSFWGRLALQVLLFWPVTAVAIVAIVLFFQALFSIITRGS